MLIYENFTECYLDLLQKVFTDPEFESAPRGQRIKEALGVSFRINNPRHRFPTVVGRDFSTSYMVAELLWYLSGNNRTEWISRYSSFWKNISDDGETANSAYGARLFFPNDKIANGRFAQYDYVVDELKKDRDSRRAVMHIRVPADSLDAKLDMPCTLSLQFFIRDEKMHMVTSMRSSDLIFGIAYDIPAFTIFQEMLANEFGIDVGTYTHISNSLHIYERHFDMVKNILEHTEESVRLAYMFGEMPKLPNDFINAVPDLMRQESLIRNANSSDEVFLIASRASHLDQYWKDWVWVLAAYACKSYNDIDKMNKCLGSVSYAGYKLGKW
jgi:thymidylate synthase